MKRVMGVLVVVGAFLMLAACDKKSDSGSGGGGGGSGGSANTGVQECDDYITKYEACIGKMDPAAKAAAQPAFQAQRDGFKQSASTPEGKSVLKGTCKQLLDGLASNPACK
jgi:hypothetical protein